jgi:hypothetical protein
LQNNGRVVAQDGNQDLIIEIPGSPAATDFEVGAPFYYGRLRLGTTV